MRAEGTDLSKMAEAAARISKATTLSVQQAADAIAALARIVAEASRSYADAINCFAKELSHGEHSSYWRARDKALARSRRNQSMRKRRRHGRAQKTRGRL